MKILHVESYNYHQTTLNLLAQYAEVECLEFANQSELLEHLIDHKYEVIFTRLGLEINREVIDLQLSLKFIVTPTTGLNHIDLKHARQKDISVISLKGEFEFLATVLSTAEHTWMLLLSLVRNFQRAAAMVENGCWERHVLMADELNTKTIGVIGYGRLGKVVANYAKAFKMKVIVHDIRDITKELESDIEDVSLKRLLRRSDFICLMINYDEKFKNFMNEEKFSLMKPGAYFINTARGELVQEDALLNVLKSGRLKGAALDVLKGDSVWNGQLEVVPELVHYAGEHNNLIITPHMGGYGLLSIQKTREFITNKFLARVKI